MKENRSRYVCMNHTPGLVFDHRPTARKPEPICPKCKTDEFVCVYSGDKQPSRNTRSTKPLPEAKSEPRPKPKQKTKTEKLRRWKDAS